MKTIILMFCLMAATCLQAQKAEDNGVESFKAIAPETVEQGVPFAVNFVLSATHWDAGAKARSGNGLTLTEASYKIERSEGNVSQLIAKTVYVTSKTGRVQLPAMSVPIDGKMVWSEPKEINVRPNATCGEEMTAAHEWLVKNGKPADKVCLRMACNENDLLLFVDKENGCFAVVAKKAVWSLVGNPVLAYGTQNIMQSYYEDKDNYNNMINPFRLQIQALKKGTRTSERPLYTPKSGSVAPLLGQQKWGQAEPYNSATAMLGQKLPWTGCVPLATAMVMSYHQWPVKGTSYSFYKYNGKLYKMEYAQCEPQWQSYKPSYEKTDNAQNLSSLIVTLGVGLDASFNRSATSACIGNIKHVLCNNMGYSGHISYSRKLTESETLAILYRELDQRRPVIVSNDSHSFVCDGYNGEFFHFNLGWYGFFNGYYRLKLGSYDSSQNLLMVSSMLHGIEPLHHEVSREVTLGRPGTLSTVLSQEEQQSVTRLKIRGSLNSSDVFLLRRMAGYPGDKVFTQWRGGSLQQLDLSEATIVTDKKTTYLTVPAKGVWTFTRTINGVKEKVRYDLEKMDLQTWNNFVEHVGKDQGDYVYSRSDDNRYWTHYVCRDSVIGPHMFDGCSSLQRIVLPANTIAIGNYAFSDCTALQAIRIPPSVKEVGQTPFAQCTSLDRIEMPRSAKYEKALYEDCSPGLNASYY